MKECSPPPLHDLFWIATSNDGRETLVKARLWFDARELATRDLCVDRGGVTLRHATEEEVARYTIAVDEEEPPPQKTGKRKRKLKAESSELPPRGGSRADPRRRSGGNSGDPTWRHSDCPKGRAPNFHHDINVNGFSDCANCGVEWPEHLPPHRHVYRDGHCTFHDGFHGCAEDSDGKELVELDALRSVQFALSDVGDLLGKEQPKTKLLESDNAELRLRLDAAQVRITALEAERTKP